MATKDEARGGDRKVRVSVDFTERSFDRLERVRENVGATSKAEVLRHALQVYEWVVEETRKGGEFFVKGPDGTPRPVVIVGAEQ